MKHLLLSLLFLVLYGAQTANLDLSLAPGVSVKNLFLYLTFAILAVEVAVTQRRRFEFIPVFAPFVLYVSYAICMWLAALLILEYPGYSVRDSLISLKSGPIEDLLILLIFFYGIPDTKRALWVLRSMLWVVIVGNVITVIDALNIPDLGLIEAREDGRIGGPIGSSNQFAYFMALLLPLIAALYWTESGIRRVLAGIGLVVSAVAFLMAVSRGGIVGLMGGAALGAFLLRAIIPAGLVARTGIAVIGCVVIALGALFAAGYGDLLLDRFRELEGSQAYASSGRTEIWARLLGVMLESPISFITGFGWWVYQHLLNMGYFRYATHSVYLDTLFNLGLVGFGLFFAIAVNVIRKIRSSITVAGPEAKPFLIAFIIGFISLLVAITFGNLFTPWLYIWALTGISLRIAASEMLSREEEIAVGTAPLVPEYLRQQRYPEPSMPFVK